jgi:hypothetical protein
VAGWLSRRPGFGRGRCRCGDHWFAKYSPQVALAAGLLVTVACPECTLAAVALASAAAAGGTGAVESRFVERKSVTQALIAGLQDGGAQLLGSLTECYSRWMFRTPGGVVTSVAIRSVTRGAVTVTVVDIARQHIQGP